MDNTLDSIRPSDVDNPQEMSYLFGRDPSILAYGQRPLPAKGTKKNLISIYEIEEGSSVEETNSISPELQTVKVYLRMKPFPRKLKLTEEQQEAYRIINSTTLFTRLPVVDNNSSCLKRSDGTNMVCRKFTFYKTFGPETTQLELFEQAVKEQMTNFLAGQNSTIMTYGTTNSGKSYTLQGTTTSPGIIPRGLEFVFSNITPKALPSYKPVHHCDVISLDPIERAQEMEIKTKLLTFASTDKHQYINAYKEMQKLLQEESPIRPNDCKDVHYSVWVSFAEIYNETVYDLLSNECQKKRTALKLATDSQGRAFIKGLRTVCVNSGSEAYQVLMAGQYNLKVAATALNARSSRSHCIFTITLLKYVGENSPDSVEVSTFAFCDLAGSERLKKTLNIGDRLKEAQNINTSLLVLGRCLKTIHEGQLAKQKVEHVGPFRESKLTRLFQKALSGKEHIALIVNINPLPNLYIETQNVLNFSAIAKKIVIEQKETRQKQMKSKFSQIVRQSMTTTTDWDATELETEEWQDTGAEFIRYEAYDDVLKENEELRKEINALKSCALTRDLQIRQEMADIYTAMMKDLEIDWKNRIKDVEEQQQDALQWSVKQVEEFYKQKLDQVNGRKRKCSTDPNDIDNDDAKTCEELEIQNSRLTSKLIVLKNNVKEFKEMNQNLSAEKNNLSFELGIMKEELKGIKNLLNAAQQDVCDDEDKNLYAEELKAQLFAKQEQVKKLKVFLNEAKEEYITITTEMREKEYLLKEHEEMLVENEEKIEELESHLQHSNICLAEKTKIVEILEEKFENQNKQTAVNEKKMLDMENQIKKLEDEKLMLADEIESLKNSVITGNNLNDMKYKTETFSESENSFEDDKSEDIFVKEEPLSDTKVDTEAEDTIDEDDKILKEIENEDKLDPELREKISNAEAENLQLRDRLAQSTTEIQSLKEDLESAKVQLKEVFEKICDMKIESVKSANTENTCSDSKTNEKIVDTGCQVDILSEEKISSVEEENSTLKERLAQSSTEVQSLKEDLESAKAELKEACKKICDMEIEITKSATTDDSDSKTNENFVDMACQVDILPEELIIDTEETRAESKGIQTIDKITKEEISQTSFIEENNDDDIVDEWAKLTIKYDDMKASYKEKCLRIEDLVEEITELKENIDSLSEEINANRVVTEEYKHSIELLQSELSLIKEEKKQINQTLQNSDCVKDNLQEQVANYESRLQEAEQELSSAKDDYFNCLEQLKTLQKDLDKRVSKCEIEHEKVISGLQKELAIANEKNDLKTKCLEVHGEKITELQNNLAGMTDLQEKISELNARIETCQAEKDALQSLLDENKENLLDLGDQLEHAKETEQEKEEEIFYLQRELKRMIHRSENDDGSDKIMEKEMKNTIKELTEAKDNVSKMEIYIEKLEQRLKDHEKDASILDQLKENVAEGKLENERLKKINDDLTNSLMEKEREMESFIKNRDEMVSKYETLVRNQVEEIEKQKKEQPDRNDDRRKGKDYCENTSEDEVILKERRLRRPRKKNISPPADNEISVIDLSGSETKSCKRHVLLPPPPPLLEVETVSEKKRSARKKKLFIGDESFQDIEPVESSVIITPTVKTRNLRSRRK